MRRDQAGGTESDWIDLGSRLRVAREETGLRQEEVANLLRISRPTLSAMEAGKTRVNSLVLQRLATLYRRDFGYFLGKPSVPAEVDRALFGQLGDLSPKDHETTARFLAFCDNLGRLRELLQASRRELPAPRPFAPGARKYAAEMEAKEERARLGTGDFPVAGRIFDLLDVLGLPVYRAPLEDHGISGLLVYHPTAGPVILVNSAQRPWRQAFSAAHEYGHYLFHRDERPAVCRIFSIGGQASDGGEASDVTEEFVNAFATELLMPEDGIKRFLVAVGAAACPLGPREAARLARHFGVSFQAMLYRLLRLRLVREGDARQMLGEDRLGRLAWQREPVKGEDLAGGPGDTGLDIERRFPASYVEAVLEAFEQGLISNGRAAELLELNRGAFDRFYRVRRRAVEAAHSEEGIEHVVA